MCLTPTPYLETLAERCRHGQVEEELRVAAEEKAARQAAKAVRSAENRVLDPYSPASTVNLAMLQAVSIEMQKGIMEAKFHAKRKK
jgi:metal-sulfur cluster biosynthetic enzyme